MKVGDKETITYIWQWHKCQECGMPAAFRISYLMSGNCRTNPASSAYGKDDCSWCSDADTYACKKHLRQLEHEPPYNMSWCASFPLKQFKHMESKVSNKEREVLKAIMLELCIKYGIKPPRISDKILDDFIIAHRQESRDALKFAQQWGVALGQAIDKQILHILR